MKILIVDDDKIIRMGLAKILKRLFNQHEVICDFQNGLLALKYLKENENAVDLVITDIKMPIMTGTELIEKSMIELNKPPIFVVLSGYDEFTYVRDTMKSGAFNYLLKPIKQEELKRVIDEVQVKMQENEKQRKVIDKSIEVLKKEFFKHMLFSNTDTTYKTDKSLLENIQLDESYVYKMVVIQRNKDSNNSITSDFIKSIIEKRSFIEYLFFSYKDNIYIIFYFNGDENKDIEKITEEIEQQTDMFIKDNRCVYIAPHTGKVWEIREQSALARKLKESMGYKEQADKYYLSKAEALLEVLAIKEPEPHILPIKLAKQYIIDNFNKNITLKDVADEVYLSQNYLSELFKKEVGEGFYDFLTNYRVKKAKEMLMTTNYKVYEIASSIGYNDSITFVRAFKKVTGQTPNNFRNDIK